MCLRYRLPQMRRVLALSPPADATCACVTASDLSPRRGRVAKPAAPAWRRRRSACLAATSAQRRRILQSDFTRIKSLYSPIRPQTPTLVLLHDFTNAGPGCVCLCIIRSTTRLALQDERPARGASELILHFDFVEVKSCCKGIKQVFQSEQVS